MIEWVLFLRMLLSLLLGALVGAERERFGNQDIDFAFGGIRSFMFIALIGALSGFISLNYFSWFIIPAFIGLIVFITVSYYLSVKLTKGKAIGLTGEFAALLMFIIGILTQTEYLWLATACTIVMTTVLYLKHKLHSLLDKISDAEVLSTLIFAIVAFVILPFLPNETFGPLNVLNPYKIWLMVVFICGMSYIGYILMKILGSDKGIGITGILGGIASSTVATTTFAGQSKEERNKGIIKLLVFATLLANAVMFIRVLVEVIVINNAILKYLLAPLLIMFIVALTCAGYFWMTKNKEKSHEKEAADYGSPLRLGPALKFGALFALMLLVVKAAEQYMGQTALYVVSIVSGFVDVDAITISMANIAGTTIHEKIAATAIILAVMSNTVIKFGYAWVFGSVDFRKKLGISFFLIILSGLITLGLM